MLLFLPLVNIILFVTALLDYSTISGHKPKLTDVDAVLEQCEKTMKSLELDPSLLIGQFSAR